MALRILPGIAIPAILAVVFCLMPSSERIVERARAETTAGGTDIRQESAYRQPHASPANLAERRMQAASPALAAVPDAPPARRDRQNDLLAISPTIPADHPVYGGRERGLPALPDRPADDDRPVTVVPGNAGDGNPPPLWSDNALASVGDCPSITAICPDPAAKGIYLWGKTSLDKGEQKKRGDNHYSLYKMDLATISFGFRKDWSIATRLGLFVDLLDGEIKSTYAGDTFKNDLTGYVLGGEIKTSVGKFNLDGRLLYGSTELKGQGLAYGRQRREAKHDSTLYGFDAKIGIPLTFGDDVKLAPDMAIRYRKLKSDNYVYSQDGLDFNADAVNSESLSVPLTVTVKKEMPTCYGMFTPRANLGVVKEFKDSAVGVRTYNAYAAATSNRGMPDKSASLFYQAGVGMDLVTHSGWNLVFDYNYLTGKKYANHSLALELGKCF